MSNSESKSSTSTPQLAEWVPHKYQEKVISLMLRQAAAGALLDPGLGKTSCTLAALKILKKKGLIKRALVVAPIRPMYLVWPAEIKKWANFNDMKVHILHGKGKNAHDVPEDTDIVLINPEGILWLMDDKYPKRFSAIDCDVLVVDESTRFKDSRTKRFQAIRKHMYRFKRRYILTGSITPNGIQDLFGQMYILDRGNALGQYVTHFRRKYFNQPNPYEPYKYVPNENAYQEIIQRISPLVIQMQAEDYLEMPELIHRHIEIELPPQARDLYEAVEDDFIALLHDGTPIVAANAAVAGGKCRQIANGAIYVDVEGERETCYLHQEKVEALKGLIEELQGAPLLCLYEFQHDLEQILAAKIDGCEVLTGKNARQAEDIVARFNRGEIPVLLGHPASMGHGLNLQGNCHHVCWYGITWNFEHYDQAIRRVYRQGQENEHVFVYHIVAKETRDATVYPVLQQKEKTQRDLLNALIEPIGLE